MVWVALTPRASSPRRGSRSRWWICAPCCRSIGRRSARASGRRPRCCCCMRTRAPAAWPASWPPLSAESVFEYLDAPIVRVTAPDRPSLIVRRWRTPSCPMPERPSRRLAGSFAIELLLAAGLLAANLDYQAGTATAGPWKHPDAAGVVRLTRCRPGVPTRAEGKASRPCCARWTRVRLLTRKTSAPRPGTCCTRWPPVIRAVSWRCGSRRWRDPHLAPARMTGGQRVQQVPGRGALVFRVRRRTPSSTRTQP